MTNAWLAGSDSFVLSRELCVQELGPLGAELGLEGPVDLDAAAPAPSADDMAGLIGELVESARAVLEFIEDRGRDLLPGTALNLRAGMIPESAVHASHRSDRTSPLGMLRSPPPAASEAPSVSAPRILRLALPSPLRRHPAGDVCATGTTTAAPIAAKAACVAV